MLRRRWRLGLRKTAVGLRPLCGFSPPHFVPPQTYGLLYGRAKTSYTAGTLCAIAPKIYWKIMPRSSVDGLNKKTIKLGKKTLPNKKYGII
jgi:hypothetical protein